MTTFLEGVVWVSLAYLVGFAAGFAGGARLAPKKANRRSDSREMSQR
jgi:hypothetical protein